MKGDLLVSYYGDDFTGSTDVMEALTTNGVPTVLFTRVPDAAQLRAFSGYRAVGLAGTSRSRSPSWMDAELPAIFAWLKSLGARHCHYKVCSTFDSSPDLGSIGRAMEIGLDVFGQRMAGLIVGAPQLRRYTAFGHLFAAYGDEIYRIDRHPVMSRHPATPMREADLLWHLAGQTDLRTGRIDPDALRAASANAILARLEADGIRVALIDVYDHESQRLAGKLLESEGSFPGPLVFGSSGVEYALAGAWRETGMDGTAASRLPLAKCTQIAVVSGSCSPTTERQIRTACESGFEGVALDYLSLTSDQGREAEADALERAHAVLQAGRSPILYTALGPEGALNAGAGSNDNVGRALGRLLKGLAERSGLRRLVVAGGDTSSHALSELDVFALTLRHPISDSPGSPVCTAHCAGGPDFELVLKGGQIGKDDYFVRLREGSAG